MQYLSYGKNHTDFFTLRHWLNAGSEFSNATKTFCGLSAEFKDGLGGGLGQLSGEWARTFTTRKHVISYVIYSYATPIAWYDTEMCSWVIPNLTYSRTTSKHQGAVRTAVQYYAE